MKESLWQDIQLGVRLMFKYPVFSLIAIISLGLGIGANTAIFSVTNALMFRPLPVIRNNDDLAWVFSTIRQGTKPISVSYKNYIDIRDENSVFSGITAFSGVPLSINSYGKAELVSGEIVSANYFSVLGVNASVGRTFLSDEDRQPGANTVIVISDGLWRRRFGADPSVAGRSIVLNGLSFTIVGVAPKGFFGAEIGSLPEVWVPMSMHDQLVLPAARYLEKGAPKLFEDRKEGWLNVIGRLKPGVSMAQALADLKTVASNLNRAHMEANKGVGITIYPLKGGLDPRERGEFLPVAAVLMVVVGVVLLIVCNNLASLLLARSSARQREIGIRLSLGASRIRLVQQLLTESM
ncbi:MAG TPA: ABC transporter permease, partial [Blastocatellia bacterium]|nr:ABC transporter permease [Blastocatellia bacterium]